MGGLVTEAEVVRLVGAVSPLLMHEFLRTGASVGELRRAVAIATSSRVVGARLSPRLRRLVDLLSAAGGDLSAGTAA